MKGTIIFIHGMFLNPRSWGEWVAYFGHRGFHCKTPHWPFHEGDPAELRRAPPPGLGELDLKTVVDEMRRVAEEHENPILVGHSLGGLIVQRLINEGIGSMGIAICSVTPNRMLSFDWGFFRNSAAITNPLKGDEPFPMEEEGFHKNFANTMSRAHSDSEYAKYAMHESRNVLRDAMGGQGKVDLDKAHAPLLFIGAGKDEIIPSSLCEKNAKAYRDEADFIEFGGRGHFICREPAWELVADRVLAWIDSRAPVPTSRASLLQPLANAR
jgi:pimeloyl-ACP methyl ester carboxylesterase